MYEINSMSISDLHRAEVYRQAVTCKALPVSGEQSGTSPEETGKANPLGGIDRQSPLLAWSVTNRLLEVDLNIRELNERWDVSDFNSGEIDGTRN